MRKLLTRCGEAAGETGTSRWRSRLDAGSQLARVCVCACTYVRTYVRALRRSRTQWARGGCATTASYAINVRHCTELCHQVHTESRRFWGADDTVKRSVSAAHNKLRSGRLTRLGLIYSHRRVRWLLDAACPSCDYFSSTEARRRVVFPS